MALAILWRFVSKNLFLTLVRRPFSSEFSKKKKKNQEKRKKKNPEKNRKKNQFLVKYLMF